MMRPVDRTSSDPSLLTQRQGHRRAVSDAGSLLGRGVAPQTNTAHLALQTLVLASIAHPAQATQRTQTDISRTGCSELGKLGCVE